MSFILRLGFALTSFQKTEFSVVAFIRVFLVGFAYDVGVGLFFIFPYSIYLLILPQRFVDSRFNKIITYFSFSLGILILFFSFFAEITFWQEFESRFNFIAVDYLIYTYEVINNINESYPLPILIAVMIILTFFVIFFCIRKNYFSDTFKGNTRFLSRLKITAGILIATVVYAFSVENSFADLSTNRYQNELSKSGIYSFFSAYNNNEINYDHFYQLMDNRDAFKIIKNDLKDSSSRFLQNSFSIERKIESSVTTVQRPNVIMITMESFSADFMKTFGNSQGITPVLDSLANESVLFTNMYSTGTRTVRGMEALSLAIPPTPGNSIVRRKNNDHLTTIGSIFSHQGYDTSFFYGGDGYFDNMNKYFGDNGYAIIDRNRNAFAKENYHAPRTSIEDRNVTFENAWGICDEDLYNEVIRKSDEQYKTGKPFYDFVMTTSNHRPFTYPDGKIDIPSGSGREGAVKYTDYAIGAFLKKIKNKPWYKNTVIVIVADHCASSAGKNEIDISKYHIPALIVNLQDRQSLKINKMCSQIDLYPTLFNLLGWNYTSNLYGKNVLSDSYIPRIFVGTYQKLAYMENDNLVILSPQQKVETFKYVQEKNEQIAVVPKQEIVGRAIANYQTAYYLYKNNGLKQNQK
ncbi:LTA synthase family protein [Chryseobacterium gleum]|uniref:LTA synthase family protein n=2 Tax=Chryseobacterium TaxID=59732 RepID=UPI00241DFD7D|nr:LTA synthase family protein [Chryseobacterium gleum]